MMKTGKDDKAVQKDVASDRCDHTTGLVATTFCHSNKTTSLTFAGHAKGL